MSCEKFSKTAPQRACTVAVNYAHLRLPGKGRVIDEFIRLAGSFLHGAADHVYFISCGLDWSGGTHGYTALRRPPGRGGRGTGGNARLGNFLRRDSRNFG